jgi:colanic acid/amylovoran biosynthesis glycosyltransferase
MSYRFARELFEAPLVVSFHGYDLSAAPYSEPGVYEGLFRQVDAVVVNSTCARDRLVALGCSPSLVHVVHYGVELEEFSWPAREAMESHPFRLLTVARLVEKKGLEFSIRAAARAREKHPDLTYDIIGEGPERAQLEQLIRDLGMQDAVILHGQRDQAYVRRYLEQADLFLLASVTAADGDREGTPVALIEAQASGLPVIASAHSGTPEVVHDGTTGFLVAERDADAIAERIRFLIDHPEIRMTMGEAGRRHVRRHFDQRQVMSELIGVYEHARSAYFAKRACD